jgi:hypothetical protein
MGEAQPAQNGGARARALSSLVFNCRRSQPDSEAKLADPAVAETRDGRWRSRLRASALNNRSGFSSKE